MTLIIIQNSRYVKAVILFYIICTTMACQFNSKKRTQDTSTENLTEKENITQAIILNAAQDNSFKALNAIQVSGENLYSTFSGLYQEHECYPPDTSFVITRAVFREALDTLLKRHFQNLPQEYRDTLIEQSVLAQETYKILECKYPSLDNSDHKFPSSGFWILPEVLNRRDVIINW